MTDGGVSQIRVGEFTVGIIGLNSFYRIWQASGLKNPTLKLQQNW